MTQEIKRGEGIREYVSILKGSYSVTTPTGSASASYRQDRGYGYAIINLGSIKLGEEAEVELTKMAQDFVERFGSHP